MWHYVQSEPGLWTVGYGEGKTWTTDSDHDSRGSAAARVAYLNGCPPQSLCNVAKIVLEQSTPTRLQNGRGRAPTYPVRIDALAGSAHQLAEMVLRYADGRSRPFADDGLPF